MPAPSNSGPPAAVQGGRELRLELLWLSMFRMVATTLLLGAIALRLFSRSTQEVSGEDSLSFLVIGVVYVMTLLYALWLRQGRAGRRTAVVQLLGDVALATSLVYLTGGAESPFAFTYLLAVVAGAILLHEEGALLTAAAAGLAYTGLVLALQARWLHLPSGTVPLSTDRIAFAILSNVLAQLLIAVLAGYLSRQLRATGGRLHARESDLRALGAFHRQILASMPSGLVTCDGAGAVTFVNRAAQQMLGVDEKSAAGSSIDALLPGARTLSPSRRGAIEVSTRHGPRTLGITVAPLEAERPGAFLAVFQDLTDLRRMEEELKRADKLAAVGRMAAQLAHEIRNPLAAMRGSAQMLGADPQGATAGRLATILIRESDRLACLLEDFLRFTRPPPPSIVRCDLAALARETLDMLQADPMVGGSRVETALEPVEARADPDQIRQVLINLLRNAAAAAGPEGRVRISSVAAGARAELRVWDSAGSISPAELPRLFEPFYSKREGGTGLGLSIAYSIVRAHEGALTATSSPEAGTELVVDIPRFAEDSVAHPGR